VGDGWSVNSEYFEEDEEGHFSMYSKKLSPNLALLSSSMHPSSSFNSRSMDVSRY
jgi:hypothetical protein